MLEDVRGEQPQERSAMTDTMLEELGYDKCLDLLRAGDVGRLAVIVNDSPHVLPVNYRLVETVDLTWIALRTRVGNVIDRAQMQVALEIDAIDAVRRTGWSVLVRGTLHHVDAEAAEFKARFDPDTWLTDERHSWLVIQPFSISGRRLRGIGGDRDVGDLGVS
jgi:nitroimidazol reductase NimA-like FMN-containing flavoprotein (pyridoxamine 5'-phosphate oxidase superfamily)